MHVCARGIRRVTRSGFRRVSSATLVFVGTVLMLGCGGGTKYPDASVNFDAKSDGTGTSTGGASGDAGAPPVVGPGSQALVTGPALLIGNGPDTCTNQEGATGDRWCAFARPSTFLGATDLWVINISKVAAGTTVKCDASDLNCLLLTSTLNDGNLSAHRFFGDTLIYYADSLANSGPTYAWRPGMNAGRKLTGSLGLNCVGHPKTDAVFCYDNLDASVAGQRSADVLVGNISAGTGLLPKIATIQIGLQTEPQKYQVGLSPAGDWVGWSTRMTPTGTENLFAQKVSDATGSTRISVAEDSARWAFSRDGARWYWLKGYNYGLTAPPLGTLQMANFPNDGTAALPAATTVRTNVSLFRPAGDKGLLAFGALNATTSLGELVLMADRDQPAQAKSIEARALPIVLGLSRDGRTAIFAKTGTTDQTGQVNFFDLNVGGLDLNATCVLTPMAISPPPYATLSEPATTAYWSYGDSVTGEFVGQYTTLSNCTSHKFSSDLWFWTSVKDQGVVFGDNFVPTANNTDVTVTLRYSSFTGASLPATGTVLQESASSTFAVLLPNVSAVLYTIFVGGSTDGLYLKSGLPFATGP